MRNFLSTVIGVVIVIVLLTITVLPSSAITNNPSEILVSTSVSEVVVVVDDYISDIGFTVNDNVCTTSIYVVKGEDVIVTLNSLPQGKKLQIDIDGAVTHSLTDKSIRVYDIRSETVAIFLSLVGSTTSVTRPINPVVPSNPDTPEIPSEPGTDEPTKPDTPGTDTPGSDEPGSDDPYRPILPPAGSVYNIAGTIPLGAGALLLFLAFFWKRKVYRILKSHAKKHGEKPEKEHLKEIADAIIRLVKDDEKYPEWKKNNDVMRRLGVDICELLDEMNYPKIVPREALATEILKAAKGRINRHRL